MAIQRFTPSGPGCSALRADALQFSAPAKTPVDGFSSERIEPRTPPLAQEPPLPKLEQAGLARDLQTRSCPVCEHLASAAFGFLSKWQSTLYADEQTQRDFAAELGFCPLHTWQLEAISSPVGASVGHARLVEEVSRLLSPSGAGAASWECPRTDCQRFQHLPCLPTLVPSRIGLHSAARRCGARAGRTPRPTRARRGPACAIWDCSSRPPRGRKSVAFF